MMNWKTVCINLFIVSILLYGCSVQDKQKDKFGVAFVTNTNGIDEQSYNQVALEGLSKFASEEGLQEEKELKKVSTKSEVKFEKKLKKLANDDYDLIIGTGLYIDKAVTNVAQNYKDIHFAVIDTKINQPNIVSVIFNENEGGFLAGLLAGMKTKTKKVGFIGGINSEEINHYKYGFIAGVKTIDKTIDVETTYANTLDNPKIGRDLASVYYNDGADIIFQVAGTTGTGVIEEARNRKKEKNKEVWVIGSGNDQYEDGLPENVILASIVKRVDKAVYDIAKQAKSNEFQGGKTLIYGINEDGIKIEKGKNNVEEPILNKLHEYKEEIRLGKIKVPSTKEEIIAFDKS